MSKHFSTPAQHLCVGSPGCDLPRQPQDSMSSVHPLGVDRPYPTEQLRTRSVLLTTFYSHGSHGQRADDKLGCAEGTGGWQKVRGGAAVWGGWFLLGV